MEKRLISGIMQRLNLNAFMISSIDEKGDVGQIFQRLAQNRINIEFINQLPLKNGYNHVILCVDSKDTHSTLASLEEIKSAIHAQDIFPLAKAGILSMFPHREHAVIIGTIIHTLSAANIPLLAMASSISAISCVINEEKIPDAISLLSREFGLS
jgi:aspartokinase